MYPYLKDDSEEEEFNALLDIVFRLLSDREALRERTAKKLIKIGKKAVRPLVCSIECLVASDTPHEEIEDHDKVVGDIIFGIGEDALPDLEDFAVNEYCTFWINDFAQELLFRIKGLEGEDRQKSCYHMLRMPKEKEGKKVWVCMYCDAESEK